MPVLPRGLFLGSLRPAPHRRGYLRELRVPESQRDVRDLFEMWVHPLVLIARYLAMR